MVFNQITLDGYFSDMGGDMSFAHSHDAEWNDFVEGNAKGGGMLLFGRVTYELMASFWPTSLAKETSPIVAEQMNNLPKVVFSRTMDKAEWHNTRLVKHGIADEIVKLKNESATDMVIMGSGSIVSQLTATGLIDEYQLVVLPIVLGEGRPLFVGLKQRLDLRLTSSRIFGNGNAFLVYRPANA